MCKCVNCGNGKVAVPSKKRCTREPQVISRSTQSSLEYLLATGESIQVPCVTRLQHFVLEALLCVNIRSMNATLKELDQDFVKTFVWEKYCDLLHQVSDEENILCSLEYEKFVSWLKQKHRYNKEVLLAEILQI